MARAPDVTFYLIYSFESKQNTLIPLVVFAIMGRNRLYISIHKF